MPEECQKATLEFFAYRGGLQGSVQSEEQHKPGLGGSLEN